MRRIWQLHEAKNKLGRMVEEAITHGPQVITKRGVKTAVVLSYAEYQQLVATQKKLSIFFCESPLVGIDLELSRDTSVVREDIAIGISSAISGPATKTTSSMLTGRLLIPGYNAGSM